MSTASAAKFDAARSGEYAVQSRIALAGYEACHDVAACLLSATLGRGGNATILVTGAGGTAQEILAAVRLQDKWRFTAVDPSPSMLELAKASVADAGLSDRVDFHLSEVDGLAENAAFDAATLIGVLHHVPGADHKAALLNAIARRMKPGAPLILAGNRHAYAGKPLFLAAWGERWRMHGAGEEEVSSKLGKILQGADPPASDAAIAELLADAGFSTPDLFFSSLFWGGWIAFRTG
jgi:tRNA (cmo5U34)-methyltransferase